MNNNNFDIIEALWLRRERKRREQKIIEGAPPLTYTAKNAGTLKNYRIYGNTVNSESVGDKTENLFDGEFLQGYWAEADGLFSVSNKWISTKKIPCKSNAQYTFSSSFLSRWAGFFWYDENDNYLSNNTAYNITLLTKTSPSNAAYMAIDIAGYPTWDNTISPSDVTDFMLVEGSTPLPYEPYGYKVPVMVNDIITNLYLPEPLKMVGDEAEYLDYAEQKQYFADGTSVDVTLPALPTIAGTNTLSVGTQVQPSSVKIEGKIKGVS